MPQNSTPEKLKPGRKPGPRLTKRMQLSLPFAVHKALMDFSQATGQHAATFVTEVLVSSLGQINDLTQAANALKQAPAVAGPALSRLSGQLTKAQADLAQLELELAGGSQ